MKLRQSQKHTVVVDFSRGSINMAAAESAGEAVRFRGITQLRISQEDDGAGEPSDGEIAARIGDEVRRRGWQGMPSACLLSRSVTSTQSFLFPAMPDAELRQAIALKLDDTLHFDLQDAHFDFRRVRERSNDGVLQVLTLVAVARKDAIRRAVGILRDAGLRPVAISAASESLANLTYYASPCDAEDATVHVDIGSESTILNLFEGRLLRFSREIDTAGESFTRALMRPVITPRGPVHLTRTQAIDVLAVGGYPKEDEDLELPCRVRSTDVLPLIEPVAQRLTAEIRQSATYLAGILDRPEVDYVVLSGTGAQMSGLDAQLEENLDVPVVSIDPVARAIAHWRLAICDDSPASPAGFSAILGYSLGTHRPINLLPKERRAPLQGVSPTQVRKVLTPPALALGASLSLAAIPIQQRFNGAYDRLRATSDQLDQRLRTESGEAQQLRAATTTLARVTRARGPVPHWSGMLKELSAALPREAHITSLLDSREGEAKSLVLSIEVSGSSRPFEEVLAELTTKLGESPFFRSVRVQDASRPRAGAPGELELILEVAAREFAGETIR